LLSGIRPAENAGTVLWEKSDAMVKNRLVVLLASFVLGIAAALWIRGLVGLLLGSSFFIMGLLWAARPLDLEGGGEERKTGRLYQIANVMLGIGLGSLAGLLAAMLLPPQFFWIFMGAGVVAMYAWTYLQRRRRG
jgi:hypothetical protein